MVLGVKDRIMQSSPDKEPQHTHLLFASCPLVSDTHTPLYIHTDTHTDTHAPVCIHTEAQRHTHTFKHKPYNEKAWQNPQMMHEKFSSTYHHKVVTKIS